MSPKNLMIYLGGRIAKKSARRALIVVDQNFRAQAFDVAVDDAPRFAYIKLNGRVCYLLPSAI